MRKLIEITFMSIDGVIDAPDMVEHAQQFFSNQEHDDYQKQWLFDADALLLGRKTYQLFSEAYPNMEKTNEGAPMDFVKRMNRIPKFIASATLKKASWNATIIQGNLAEEIRKIKSAQGGNIIKYGTGLVDKVLFPQQLIDLFCIIIYPFILGHGSHLFEGLELTTNMDLSAVKRFENGTMVLAYTPKQTQLKS